jgi:hypothetical protein
MAFDAAEFAEDTEFERLVLDLLGTHRLRVNDPATVHDIRGDGRGSISVKVGTAVQGTSLRDELRNSLRPILFGAAYKVLDMLVEHVLRANGAAGRLTFARKRADLAQPPQMLPVPLDAQRGIWERLITLFVQFEEARHAVTHRRAQPTPDGGLEIYDDARQMIDKMTSVEIQAFAAAVLAVAELVIDESSDNRRIRIAAWYLNALDIRHRAPALPAIDPNAGHRQLMMDLEVVDDRHLRFDLVRAREVIEQQPDSVWDLVLHAGVRVFTGHWDDVPTEAEEAILIDVASLPEWLSEEWMRRDGTVQS